MESIIRELISIDEKAKKIVAGAENDLSHLDGIIESKAAEILEEIESNVNTKIAQMRADSMEYISRKKIEIDKDVGIRLKAIEADYRENSARWQDEIFKACTVRE